jgi:hypothetical protein
MPEKLEIIVVYDAKPAPGRREEVFEAMRASVGPRFGRPRRLMCIDVDVPRETTVPWEERSRFLPLPLGREQLLCVYEEEPRGGSFLLEESARSASYGLAFSWETLRGSSLDELETKLGKVYRAASAIASCAVFCGPELDVNIDDDDFAAVRQFFGRHSLAWWIVAPSPLLPRDVSPFHVVRESDGITLLRRDRAADWLGDKLA